MVALSIARSTRSGTFVGPGICRKCRPAWYCVMLCACSRVGALLSGLCRETIGPMMSATTAPGDSRLAQRLAREIRGDVLFGRADRGRYATDASIYQVEPIGVIVP